MVDNAGKRYSRTMQKARQEDNAARTMMVDSGGNELDEAGLMDDIGVSRSYDVGERWRISVNLEQLS